MTKNKEKYGEDVRDLIIGLSTSYKHSPTSADGFLTPPQQSVIQIIIKFSNKDSESCCRLSNADLEFQTGLSEKTIKRTISELKNLRLLKIKRTDGISEKQLNGIGWQKLSDIIKGQDDWCGACLRREMKRTGIISIFDVDEKMIEKVRKEAQKMYMEHSSEGSNLPHRSNFIKSSEGSNLPHRSNFKSSEGVNLTPSEGVNLTLRYNNITKINKKDKNNTNYLSSTFVMSLFE